MLPINIIRGDLPDLTDGSPNISQNMTVGVSPSQGGGGQFPSSPPNPNLPAPILAAIPAGTLNYTQFFTNGNDLWKPSPPSDGMGNLGHPNTVSDFVWTEGPIGVAPYNLSGWTSSPTACTEFAAATGNILLSNGGWEEQAFSDFFIVIEAASCSNFPDKDFEFNAAGVVKYVQEEALAANLIETQQISSFNGFEPPPFLFAEDNDGNSYYIGLASTGTPITILGAFFTISAIFVPDSFVVRFPFIGFGPP